MGRLLKLIHSDGVAAAPPSYPDLQPLIASAVWDCDATSAASYTSGQTWANLVAAPADGSAQTAYDFQLGATTGAEGSDPTFVGTPGSASCKFTLDGGDYFQIKNGNTTFIKNLQKKTAGSPSSICLVGKFPVKANPGAGGAFFGTNGRDPAKAGVCAVQGDFFDPSEFKFLASNGADGFYGGYDFASDPNDATYRLICVTFNPATGAVKFYNNSSTPVTGSLSFYNDGATDPILPLQIMADGAAASIMAAGGELVAHSGFNAVLVDAQITILRNSVYGVRHSRTY